MLLLLQDELLVNDRIYLFDCDARVVLQKYLLVMCYPLLLLETQFLQLLLLRKSLSDLLVGARLS